MSISKRHLNRHPGDVKFDPEKLGEALENRVPEAVFCLLMGSAVKGVVAENADLDLAFYLDSKPAIGFYSKVEAVVEDIVPGVRCDIGILNGVEPIYQFEALKGRLLFTRDREQYAAFFSLSCRKYESQMFDYEKQLRYRREVRHAV